MRSPEGGAGDGELPHLLNLELDQGISDFVRDADHVPVLQVLERAVFVPCLPHVLQ